MRADRLEHVEHRDILALELAGHNRAAIKKHAWHIQPQHRHHHTGQRLVTARNANQRIIGMPAHGQLNTVSNHLPAHQRGAHPLMAHSDAVRHRDRAKLARRSVGGFHTFRDCMCLPHQGRITRGRFIPAGRYTDKRLFNVLGREPHRIIIAAVRRALRPFGHMAGRQAGFIPSFGHYQKSCLLKLLNRGLLRPGKCQAAKVDYCWILSAESNAGISQNNLITFYHKHSLKLEHAQPPLYA